MPSLPRALSDPHLRADLLRSLYTPRGTVATWWALRRDGRPVSLWRVALGWS